ncbi:G5 domain-containing protein [Virgibacillus sp. LDC1]|uniref:G5 domain-containing protein n=1 Tax=Paenibacillus TaxID=44249 RepID=UPI002DB80737|nr:G5 domain-containing protein [Paenibacillus lautus]MCV4235926.1 G5 domain-containing protein [Virgibacillus sp. LDC1]MEC0260172.1 G5 domain-containing protein [Paenibacillus lautus]MEC0308411.1 G5 domain-containing protein [Paenibacillus lautus]
MGIFQPEETHESQSSSMSYALRWKHDNLRQLMLLGAMGAVTVSLLISLVVHDQAGKEVQLVVDGRVTTVETRGSLLQELLDEQAITLSPQDQISMPLNGAIQDGDRIIIERAIPVKVTVGSTTKTIFTSQDTVDHVLKEAGVTIQGEDIVQPSQDTKLTSNMNIHVVRVTKQKVKETEDREFRVIKTADPSLEKGDNRVIQRGEPGLMVNHYEKVYHNGKLVSKTKVSQEIERRTKDKIIAVGTKKVEKPVIVQAAATDVKATPAKLSGTKKVTTAKAVENNVVSRAGVDFKYKKVLNNVSMTAYSAEQQGIGTRTASGTRVTEGRTIAVDPNIIPIGWWVYIEGIGFRRAEDTGGAIKGNKIDVYYDSLKSAMNFGRKSGRTVYVIGPVKPELN